MCEIESNSDVTGTGIRASIYTLCLASGIFKAVIKHFYLDSYEDFARSIDSALQLQGLALLCTAIYQTFRQQLTLFHAICILHLLSLLGFGLAAKGKYGRKGRNRRLILLALKIPIAAAFLGFVAYIWVTAPRFGSQPECNATTVYVVFGVSFGATETVFRYVVLALMIVTVVATLIGLLMFGACAACFCGTKRKDKVVRSDDFVIMTEVLRRIQFKDKKTRWAMLQGDIFEVLLRTAVNVYAIVTLEETIRRNNLGPAERDWTFGQVLAIFLLLGVAAEVLNIFLAKMDIKETHEPVIDEEGAEGANALQGNQQQLLMDGTELQDRPSVQRTNSTLDV